MTMPAAALQFQKDQRRLADTATAATRRAWARMGDDFDAGWRTVRPRLEAITTAAQLAAARRATPYLELVLAETGMPDGPLGALRARQWAGVAPDGRSLGGFLDGALVAAKDARRSVSTPAALARGGRWLDMATQTVVADTSRSAVLTGIVVRPELDGYVRATGPSACTRCALLGGKFYRYSAGFLRHPRCHCVNVPATRGRARDFIEAPTVTPAPVTDLDVAARSRAGRAMPEQIVAATANRDDAIRELRRAGFVAA